MSDTAGRWGWRGIGCLTDIIVPRQAVVRPDIIDTCSFVTLPGVTVAIPDPTVVVHTVVRVSAPTAPCFADIIIGRKSILCPDIVHTGEASSALSGVTIPFASLTDPCDAIVRVGWDTPVLGLDR